MPYLPLSFPAVTPTPDDAPFWAACAEERLAFQRCADCGRFRHPPTPLCAACRSARSEWVEAPPMGRLYSFTVVRHPAHPAADGAVPYNVVLVEFPDCGGVRLVSNVVDAAPEDLAVGAAVALVWDDGPGGRRLPRFRLAAPAGSGS